MLQILERPANPTRVSLNHALAVAPAQDVFGPVQASVYAPLKWPR